MSQASVELLKQLTEADGVPGFEDEVRAIVEQRLEGVGEVSRDPMGNVYCTKRGTSDSPRVMLDCHLDEVGFLVQNITAQGFIKLIGLGGWWTHTLPSQRVRIITNQGKVPGIIGATPPHLLSSNARDKVMKLEDLYVDVGAADREQVMQEYGIQLGNPVVPDTSFQPLQDPNLLSAKAFDNRVGTALLIETMEQLTEHPNMVLGVGSVQEEVGIRGATTSVVGADPDIAFVLEGPPADDTPGMPLDMAQGKLGAGPQIRLFDPSMIANPRLSSWVLEVAEAESISHQVAVRRSGGTDGRAIHLHRQGVPTIVIGVPTRYIHSHTSVIHLNDYLAAQSLMIALLSRLDRAVVETIKKA